MNGPTVRRESACMGAVLLSNSKDPIVYFLCNEPIDCLTNAKMLSLMFHN